jgi:hypothetical protein
MHPNPFGLAFSQSPVDLPESLISPHPLRWTTTVIAVAALVLAVLNAPAIRGWAWQLPPGPWSERAVTVAESWYGMIGRFGLNRPVETMHRGWQGLRDARFDRPAVDAPPVIPAKAGISSSEELGVSSGLRSRPSPG